MADFAAAQAREDATVDLRSDTVTKPTDAMYDRILSAPLGDDGQDGDPTVQELEETTASLLGKEAALFVPSCTMANLLAIIVHTSRQKQLLAESQSHIYCSERGSATFTGAFYQAVDGHEGAMDLNLLEASLQGNYSYLSNGLIAIESSHNNAGGAVLPLAHMKSVQRMGAQFGVPIHLDGARMFNAAAALNVRPSEIAGYCDSAAVCLSKGLSAPVGALLVGRAEMIAKARAVRRMLGGQQRQAGIVAAAGLEAITGMRQRLAEDHRRAASFSRLLTEAVPTISTNTPQTNIVQVNVSRTGVAPDQWAIRLIQHGLLVRPWANGDLRCVFHRHIEDAEVKRAVDAFRLVYNDFQPSSQIR
ncbi:threonine aldolase [Rhizorhabdus wittichii DC-6]|nr:threonine aldolase [Rhizorhabdus wittichii DC-6]